MHMWNWLVWQKSHCDDKTEFSKLPFNAKCNVLADALCEQHYTPSGPKFELGIPTPAVHEHHNNPGEGAGSSKIACNAIAHLAARWCVHVRTPKYTQPNCNPLRSRVHYLPILRLHATSNMHLLRCSTVGRVVITKNRSVVGEFGRLRTSPCERPT